MPLFTAFVSLQVFAQYDTPQLIVQTDDSLQIHPLLLFDQ